MADANCYEGGIPNQGFNGTFPSSSGSETMYKPDRTKGAVDVQDGGPVSGAGKSDDGGFVKDAGAAYGGSADLADGVSMKVIDLNDIKSSV